jgi:hypothetical protein
LLDIIFEQYLESEFRDNDQMYIYNKKLLALDPFPHLKIEQVVQLNDPQKLKQKIFVNEYKNSVDIKHVISTPLKELKLEYTNFINNKNE